jgi:hypothetical protein
MEPEQAVSMAIEGPQNPNTKEIRLARLKKELLLEFSQFQLNNDV